jgi:hypothetical protein
MPYSLGAVSDPKDALQEFFSNVSTQVTTGQLNIAKPYDPQPLPVKPLTGDIPFEPLISPKPSMPTSAIDLPTPFSSLFERLLIGSNDPNAIVSFLERWKISDFPDVVYEELERQVKPIDSELYLYMTNAPKDLITLETIINSIISVGSYPHVRKVNAMKEAFSEGGKALSKLSPFFNVRYNRLPSYGTRTLLLGDAVDPEDPAAPSVPLELAQAEIERRQRWKKAWLDYISNFRRRLLPEIEKKIFVYFSCELPTEKVKPKISPRLRLPTGEYLEPVTVTGTILPVGPVVPQPQPISPLPTEIPLVPQPVAPVTEMPVGGVVPVSEEKDEKKDEKKKFPWWVVVVIVAVVALFFMKK